MVKVRDQKAGGLPPLFSGLHADLSSIANVAVLIRTRLMH